MGYALATWIFWRDSTSYVNIIHEPMLENSYEVGSRLEIIWLSTPIGRGSGFKIRKVWIRIPPELPLSPLEMIYSGWFIDYYYGDENVS